MASKVMTARIEAIVDATYQAMCHHQEVAAISVTNMHIGTVHLWEHRYGIVKELNAMMREGFSDTALNNVWDALKPELMTELSMVGYGIWIRKLYPRPKTPKLVKIESFEQRLSTQRLRAQQMIEIKRNQALAHRIAKALY